MKNQVLVTIKCLVYNHEPYLRQCLDGFVMQKTNFKFVAIVHDDCSTDGSKSIIQEYEAKYPEIIKPIYEKENQWSKHDSSLLKIMFDAIQATGCKYVALCEGDDYWTDPYKLQKQINILENDYSLMACATNCLVVDFNNNIIKRMRSNIVIDNVEKSYNLREFFKDNHQYPTLSVVYRNSHSDEVFKKMKIMSNPYFEDWILWIALLCFGNFYFLNDVTCAYRINPTSLTHNTKLQNDRRLGMAKDQFRLFPLIASILPNGYEDIKSDLCGEGVWMWYNLAHAYKKSHKYCQMCKCLIVCFVKDPCYTFMQFKKRCFSFFRYKNYM